MSRRFKSPTMKFGVPLSVHGSLYVEPCYGLHGKGYGHCPPSGADIELILMNAQRQLWRVSGSFPERYQYRTDATTDGSGWKILGWRMMNGTMPLGEYDAVDPDLAQLDYLPAPNSEPARSHSTPFMSQPYDR